MKGMAVLQRKDLIHRDLKPDNILISFPEEGNQSTQINKQFKKNFDFRK